MLAGRHGTNPFYCNPETLHKIMQAGPRRKSVFIWPELTILYKDQFTFAGDNLYAPFTEDAQIQHHPLLAQ